MMPTLIKRNGQSFEEPILKRIASIITLACLCLVVSIASAQEQNEKPIELSGFSISQAYDVKDGLPLNLDDSMLIRTMYRIRKTSPKSRWEYSNYSRDVSWENIEAQTDDYRFWVFDRHVRLRGIQEHRFAGASEDEIQKAYICHCVSQTDAPMIVLAESVPSMLVDQTKLDEPVRLSGFLYSKSIEASVSDLPVPVFIASRLGWFPTNLNIEGVRQSHVDLARNGFDVGNLDTIKKNNTKPLSSSDSESLFQMIKAVSNIPPPSAEETTVEQPLGFQELMQNAGQSFGKTIQIKGIIRSCSVIKDLDPDVQTRLGLSSYYQLMVFPDLDGKKIVIKSSKGNDDINDRFPITVCCAHLPDGMTPDNIERKPCRINGFVYRFWKFQSERTDEGGFSGQVSPILIAYQPTILDIGADQLDSILLIFVSVVLAGIALLLLSYRLADRKSKTRGQVIMEGLPDKIDVPDFDD
jgi:hypothetical protein